MCWANTENKKIANKLVLKRNIITTGDGSKTIQIEEWNEQYHSVHGAIQEANHVFIKHGFVFCLENVVNNSGHLFILEIGFGTGLNAFLTFQKGKEYSQNFNYIGIEAYPVALEEILQLNYIEQLNAEHDRTIFATMHDCCWEIPNNIAHNFQLTKQQKDFKNIRDESIYDLIYFDAFGARVQPELWTEDMFEIMFRALKPKGVLVTYSAKGSVRRAMQSVGFLVEKLPGPPGKREMLRAIKNN